MSENNADWLSISQEISKLPPRAAKGNEWNIIRALAAGFIFAGNPCDVAVSKAKAMKEFYDWLAEVKDEQGNQGRR